jgi:hypothetical protein
MCSGRDRGLRVAGGVRRRQDIARPDADALARHVGGWLGRARGIAAALGPRATTTNISTRIRGESVAALCGMRVLRSDLVYACGDRVYRWTP